MTCVYMEYEVIGVLVFLQLFTELSICRIALLHRHILHRNYVLCLDKVSGLKGFLCQLTVVFCQGQVNQSLLICFDLVIFL